LRAVRWQDRIGRRLKLRDLHVLLTVAQCGSMAKAAEQLSVSYPVISKAVADLEHAVCVPLLDCSSRGPSPTSYGQALIDRAGVASRWCGGADITDRNRASITNSGDAGVAAVESSSASIVVYPPDELGGSADGEQIKKND
jgi:hypothetical protein